MKHQFKITLLALGLLFMNGAMAAETATGNTGLREEASTLENIYQEKARAVLDTLMTPEDYTMVVSATIKNDEAKLKEYHDMVERKFMPGMVMNDPAGFGEEHNILHSLKQKVEIQVILNDRVPSDRDTLVRDILKSKLKLNEEGGDTIGVVRAFHTPLFDPSVLKKLPELSGKMIFFLLLLCGLLVAGIAMWLYKRHENRLEEARARGAQILERERLKEAIEEEKKADVKPSADTGKTPEQLREEKRALEEKIFKRNEEIIALSQEYNGIVTKALEEYVSRGKLEDITLFFESIGWDHARKYFKNIETKLWTKLPAIFAIAR